MKFRPILFAAMLIAPLPPAMASEPILAPASRIGIPERDTWVRQFGLPVEGPQSVCNGTLRRLVLLTPRVRVGDPVLFRLIVERDPLVRNPIFFSRVAFSADYSFFVAPPGTQGFFYSGESTRSDIPFTNFDFAGGNIFTVDFWMLYDPKGRTGMLTESTGTHVIRAFALCRDGQGKEQSEISFGDFEVEVSPASPANSTALAHLNDPSLLAFLQAETWRFGEQPRPFSEADVEKLRTLADVAPSAGITPHALFVAADYFLSNQRPIEGVQLLQSIREDYPDHPIHDRAAARLLEILYLAQRDDYAVPLFVDLWTDPDRTRMLLETNPAVQTYVAPYRIAMGPHWNLFTGPGPEPSSTIDDGLRIELSEEVQQQLGLPANVTLEQLRGAGIQLQPEG